MANYIELISGVPIGIVACGIVSQPVLSFVHGTCAGYRQLMLVMVSIFPIDLIQMIFWKIMDILTEYIFLT